MKLLTVTWSGDRAHFELLRYSLDLSGLSRLPHEVIVQDEDIDPFRDHDRPPLQLRSSADILPPSVERHRRRAHRRQGRFGRRLTTLAGSLARRLNWPRWVRYTGWHTQQLCKLFAAAQSDENAVVVMDSDLVVSPMAACDDFQGERGIVCYQRWVAALRTAPTGGTAVAGAAGAASRPSLVGSAAGSAATTMVGIRSLPLVSPLLLQRSGRLARFGDDRLSLRCQQRRAPVPGF